MTMTGDRVLRKLSGRTVGLVLVAEDVEVWSAVPLVVPFAWVMEWSTTTGFAATLRSDEVGRLAAMILGSKMKYECSLTNGILPCQSSSVRADD